MTFDIGYMQANPIRWGPGEIDESEEGGNREKGKKEAGSKTHCSHISEVC